jgi:esterase
VPVLIPSDMGTLSHVALTPEHGAPEQWVIFLHGLLGRGGNWRSFARRWVEAHPSWGVLLADLRLHGGSQQGFSPPHSVPAAAADVLSLVDATPRRVSAVVGHSLGGKVALATLRARPGAFSRVVVLDASPAARPDGTGSEQSRDILALLRRLPERFPSRAAFVSAVESAGQPRDIAQWLAMNLAPEPEGGFGLTIDLDGMESLFRSVLSEDDWDVVSALPDRIRLTFIVGANSGVVEPETGTRLAQLPRVRVEVIPNAGHWLHVDAPEATFAAVARALLGD